MGFKQVSIPYLTDGPEDLQLSVAQLCCHTVGLAFTVLYTVTRHFLCNNGLGMAYCLEVRHVQLGDAARC